MFSKIVIGVDGRGGGLDALRLARRLAARESTLVAACVALGEDAVADAEQVIEQIAAERPDVRGEVFVATDVAKGLHEIAAREGADLLVVGSCHRGVLGRLALGDDARRALRDAPCAVALAPQGYRHRDAPIRTVGIGFVRGPQGETAVALARAVAADEGAALRALHVVTLATWVTPPNVYAPGNYDASLREAQAALDALDGVSGEAVLGGRAGELAGFAGEVDLLVVGSRHHSALGRVVLGSTVEQLATSAKAPLLVAPAARDGAGNHGATPARRPDATLA